MPGFVRTIVSALALGTTLAGAAPAQDDRPNILLVLFDDAGFTDFGVYGSETRTPTIDALARDGMIFSSYYTAPFCGPSRAMLMTGLDNHQVGMGTLVETVTPEMSAFPGYSMRWSADQETLATRLSETGYQTYVSGKWGIGESGANLPDRFGFDRSFVMDSTGGSNYDDSHYLPGYDRVAWYENGQRTRLPEDFYSSRTLVDRMIDYVDSGDPELPFFAFLSFQALHIPVQAPIAFIDGYDGVFDEGWDVLRERRLERAISLGLVPSDTILAPTPDTHRGWEDLTAEEQAVSARMMQVNAGMMEAADHHLGRLIDHLADRGLLENTIIIVTSDNGAESATTDLGDGIANMILDGIKLIEGWDTSPENLGQPGSINSIGPEWASVSSAPFNLYKFYAGEGGLRVPLVIAGPGVAPAGVQSTPAHVADLTPTLLELAGVAAPVDEFYGRSLLPLLSGAASNVPRASGGFGFEVSGNAALYRGDWKITRNAPPLGDGEWRLYDLSVDPGETSDIYAIHPDLFADMLVEYRAYAAEVGVYELPPDVSAYDQLTRNLVAKSIGKYWPYLIVVLMILVGLAVLAWLLAKAAFRGLRR